MLDLLFGLKYVKISNGYEMMDKINDIQLDLESKLDISNIHKNKNLCTDNLTSNNISDIREELVDIDISGNKYSFIHKLKTKRFDSLYIDKNIENIDLLEKESFIQKYKNKLKFNYKEKPFKSKKLSDLSINNNKFFFKKVILIFTVIFFILFLDKLFIEYKINSGYNKILSLKDFSGDINDASKIINNAKLDFIVGNIFFTPFLLIPNENIKNGFYVLSGGKDLTKMLDKSLETYKKVILFIEGSGGIDDTRLTDLIYSLRNELFEINNLLYKSIVSYNNITNLDNNLMSNKFNDAKSKLLNLYKISNLITQNIDTFLDIFGHTKEKKYLVVFQNNDEIRPSGGFMGSMALVSINKGRVTNIENSDVYSYEWDINKVYSDKAIAPKGLDKITGTFGLRDANYFLEYDENSKSIKYFLDKIDKKIDGILYINQNVIHDFLETTGEIEFKKIGKKITSDNFSMIISTLVEAKVFKLGLLGSPKQILFDFSNDFIGKIKSDKKYVSYLSIIYKNILSRDIVFYSFTPDENSLLWKLGLNGKINYSSTLDFNYPIFTSIGGNKSDRYIKYKYKKDIHVNNDCSIDTNLIINRTHLFTEVEESNVNKLLDEFGVKFKRDILNIQGRGDNSSFVRLILPKEAVINNEENLFTISTNKYYKVIDFYITTRRLESTTNTISYKLNNKECLDYNYTFYKQAGINNYDFDMNNNGIINESSGLNRDYIYKK